MLFSASLLVWPQETRSIERNDNSSAKAEYLNIAKANADRYGSVSPLRKLCAGRHFVRWSAFGGRFFLSSCPSGEKHNNKYKHNRNDDGNSNIFHTTFAYRKFA